MCRTPSEEAHFSHEGTRRGKYTSQPNNNSYTGRLYITPRETSCDTSRRGGKPKNTGDLAHSKPDETRSQYGQRVRYKLFKIGNRSREMSADLSLKGKPPVSQETRVSTTTNYQVWRSGEGAMNLIGAPPWELYIIQQDLGAKRKWAAGLWPGRGKESSSSRLFELVSRTPLKNRIRHRKNSRDPF